MANESNAFLHDADARNDTKILMLRAVGGWEYYGLYFALVEMLRNASNYSISWKSLPAVAMHLSIEVESLNEFLKIACSEEIQLFLKDEQFFWSPSLLRRMEAFDIKRQVRKDAALRRWKESRDANAMQMHNTCTANDVQMHCESNAYKPNPIQPNTIQPKQSKKRAVFNPEGKTKYLDWVYLDDSQLERVKTYYKGKGLDSTDFDEAVRELDRWFVDNPHMREKRVDDAKTLMGWPLDRALQRKRELTAVNRQKFFQAQGGRR